MGLSASAALGALLLLYVMSPHCRSSDGMIPTKNISIDLQQLKEKDNIVGIAIIGSGCAGLSAAVYAARGKQKTVVISGETPGGLLSETTYVENWPGAKKELGTIIVNKIKDQSLSFGAEYMADEVTRIDFSSWPYQLWTQDGKHINALSVIIATGAKPRLLNVPGEKEYWGKGVTTCAICDAPFHEGKDVIVVGGGDSAIEEAFQLEPFAKNITLLVRKDSMRASPAMQDRLKDSSKIKVQYNTEVTAILGNNEEVTSVELINNKTNAKETKNVSGVFLAIGHVPNSELFKEYIAVDENGYIQLQGRTQATSLPGVFAAGDVEDHRYRQAGVASGHGIEAALDALAFLGDIGFNNKMADDLEERSRYLELYDAQTSPIDQITTLEAFEELLHKSTVPVIVDFYTQSCPSCLKMMPYVGVAAHMYADNVKFVKVDAGQAVDIAKKYKISSVPCFLVFKDGSLIARYKEVMNKKELLEFTKRFVMNAE